MKTYELFVYNANGEPIGAAGCFDANPEKNALIPKYSPYLNKHIGKANVKLKSNNYYCAVGIFDFLNEHEKELKKYLLRREK